MPNILDADTYERVLGAVNDGLDRLYDHWPFDPAEEPGMVTYERVVAWICADHGVVKDDLYRSMTFYTNPSSTWLLLLDQGR